MLPITIGVIGAKNTKSVWQSFSLSIVYILGIAITYAILGVFAALTGSLFGSLLQNPIMVSSIAIIFFLMGLSMLDVFYVQVPSVIQTRLSKIYQKQTKGNYLNVAVMGLISGLIATPCVGPVIVSMLTYVAQTKNVFLGFWLLFTFAIGMGLILVIFGTFSNALVNLPRAGGWMENIKKLMGLGMFGVAFYYLRPILPYDIFTLILGGFLVIVATFIGFFDKIEQNSTSTVKLQKSVSILILLTGIYLFVNSLASKNVLGNNLYVANIQNDSKTDNKKDDKATLTWLKTEEEGIKQAKLENKFIMIDFYADWCPSCIELDKYTYTDKDVIKEMGNNINIKIDATKLTPEIKNLFNKYGVVGLPAVIFIDKSGKVIEELTLSGYEKSGVFIRRLQTLKLKNANQAA